MDRERYRTLLLTWCSLLKMVRIRLLSNQRREEGNTYDYKRTVRVLPNTQYKVQAVATIIEPKKQEYPIQFNGLNRSNNPIEVSGKNANNQNNTLRI